MAAAPPDAHSREGRDTAEVSAVVVNWRRPEATIACCQALLSWQQPPRVVVVDNGSSAETVERLRQALPSASVLAAGTNRGFGGANNLALEQCDGDFVLLLNNDAELTEAAATLLLDSMLAQPQVGIAGPVLEAASAPHSILAAGGRNILRHGRTHRTAAESAAELEAARPFPVDYVPGTAVMVRRSLLEELGGFDEAYFFSGEMADFSARARQHGLASVIVPQARARHDLDLASDLRESLYAYYSLRNRFLYARRHARAPGLSLARWAARGCLSSLAALARGKVRRARWLAAAVVDGTSGRFGEARRKVPA